MDESSRAECMDRSGTPTSTVSIPSRVAVSGPMVLPQVTALFDTNSWVAWPDSKQAWSHSAWPFAPEAAVQYFAAGLDTYTAHDADLGRRIERENALALFPRLGTATAIATPSLPNRIRGAVTRTVMRGVTRLAAGA